MTALRRLAFRVEYDGTGFHGWQAQPTGIPTIQQALHTAIGDLVGAEVRVDGASRTDAGVHAVDQLAAVSIEHPIVADGFVKAVNQRLPDAVAIRDAREVPLDFAPRFANRGKMYRYRIHQSRVRRPLLDRTHWRLAWPLDPERLVSAVPLLLGRHDFASFAASDGSHRTTERTLWRVAVEPGVEDTLSISISGDAFLKHMVRNLVGTLVDVARGHTAPERVGAIIAARDRTRAGPTAPARGLCLERVYL